MCECKAKRIVKQYRSSMTWWEVDIDVVLHRTSRALTTSKDRQLDLTSISGMGMVPTRLERGFGDTDNLSLNLLDRVGQVPTNTEISSSATNLPQPQNLRQEHQDNPTTSTNNENGMRLDNISFLLITKTGENLTRPKGSSGVETKDNNAREAAKRERSVLQYRKITDRWSSTQSSYLWSSSAPSSSQVRWSS